MSPALRPSMSGVLVFATLGGAALLPSFVLGWPTRLLDPFILVSALGLWLGSMAATARVTRRHWDGAAHIALVAAFTLGLCLGALLAVFCAEVCCGFLVSAPDMDPRISRLSKVLTVTSVTNCPPDQARPLDHLVAVPDFRPLDQLLNNPDAHYPYRPPEVRVLEALRCRGRLQSAPASISQARLALLGPLLAANDFPPLGAPWPPVNLSGLVIEALGDPSNWLTASTAERHDVAQPMLILALLRRQDCGDDDWYTELIFAGTLDVAVPQLISCTAFSPGLTVPPRMTGLNRPLVLCLPIAVHVAGVLAALTFFLTSFPNAVRWLFNRLPASLT